MTVAVVLNWANVRDAGVLIAIENIRTTHWVHLFHFGELCYVCFKHKIKTWLGKKETIHIKITIFMRK